MGWGAGRKLFDVLLNTRRVLAVELMCAAQALDYRRPLAPAPLVAAACDALRQVSPSIDVDRAIAGDIEAISDLVADGSLVAAAEGLD
jgi:histidine ammonia-lyase